LLAVKRLFAAVNGSREAWLSSLEGPGKKDMVAAGRITESDPTKFSPA
jgi:hypothetical protein